MSLQFICSAGAVLLLTSTSLIPLVTSLQGLVTLVTIILMVNDEDVRLRVLGHARAVIIGAGYLQAGRGLLLILLLLSLSCGESSDLIIISLRWLQEEMLLSNELGVWGSPKRCP